VAPEKGSRIHSKYEDEDFDEYDAGMVGDKQGKKRSRMGKGDKDKDCAIFWGRSPRSYQKLNNLEEGILIWLKLIAAYFNSL